MLITKSELEAVAVKPAQYPPDDRKEIAFAGRSNVGKSSLLNLLTGRKSLARVSGSPGKTRTINFYSVNDSFRIVDLPGYGYARVSRSVTEKWGDMVDAYLKSRQNLTVVVLLADIRHKPTAQDIQLYEWLRAYRLDGLVAATKADKISKSEASRNLRVIRETLGLADADKLLPVSVLKRTGVEDLLAALEDLLR
ncbi:MAG: ribosome biogenesis GTP-binding protein YihA/YsxC [Clostridiales Family XIII bacterium]|jgi:GTP-binding protein|nr:ribosome biogenesis GTP-binding protein YihA/YsxC [Clostridiales Family XIII bacterium]